MASSFNSTASGSDDRYKKLAVAGLVIIPVLLVLLMYDFRSLSLLLMLLLHRRRQRSPVVPTVRVGKQKDHCSSGTMIINEDSMGFAKTKEVVKPETSMLTEHEPVV